MSKAKKGQTQNLTYQTQPTFKDKFRPAVSTHSPTVSNLCTVSPRSDLEVD